MPNEKRKGVSMKKAARAYKRAHTKPKVEHNGSHYFDGNAQPYSLGSGESKLKYKPKARAATFGGSDGNKPVTRRVRRARAK